MKLVELQHRGFKVVFMVVEDAAKYIKGMEADFLDDPDERAFFEMLFPDQLDYVIEQVNRQVEWQKNLKSG